MLYNNSAVYELRAPGRDGREKLFEKPWAMTTVMFLGMSFCLPIAYAEQRRLQKKKEHHEAAEPLLGPVV